MNQSGKEHGPTRQSEKEDGEAKKPEEEFNTVNQPEKVADTSEADGDTANYPEKEIDASEVARGGFFTAWCLSLRKREESDCAPKLEILIFKERCWSDFWVENRNP